MRTRFSLSVLCISLFAGSAQAQPVWYVNDDGDTNNGCTSWEDACPELQKALSLAEAGDQIWVATGTYKPDYDLKSGQHTEDRAASFQLISSVSIYGGFDGTEKNFGDRAGLFDETIISGDLLANDLVDAFPNGSSFEDNSYHVVTAGGTDDLAILDGFTITAGHDTRPTPDGRGAGIYNVGGDFTLNNCIITRNYSFSPSGEPLPRGRGGGMYSEGGSPTVSGCYFRENRSGGAFSGSGGGLYNGTGGDMTVTYCTFSYNTAQSGPWSSEGGGMVNESGVATISNSTFLLNSGGYGGGLRNVAGGAIVVNDCTFLENTAGRGGGLSEGNESVTEVTHCLFAGNLGSSGGGMSVTNGTPTVSDCIFINNVSSWRGGGLYYAGGPGSANIFNCKFVGNSAALGRPLRLGFIAHHKLPDPLELSFRERGRNRILGCGDGEQLHDLWQYGWNVWWGHRCGACRADNHEQHLVGGQRLNRSGNRREDLLYGHGSFCDPFDADGFLLRCGAWAARSIR